MTLTHRLENDGTNPLSIFTNAGDHTEFNGKIDECIREAISSMEKQRFKEALRHVMNISQAGNGYLQNAAPWKYLGADDSNERSESLSALAACWRACRALAVLTAPFLPFQAERLWEQLGEEGKAGDQLWDTAHDIELSLIHISAPTRPS